MRFQQPLAKYYLKWFRDCHDSAVFCKKLGDVQEANNYLEEADKYFEIINDNWEEIEKEDRWIDGK
jgi:hypothetical protein